jgi:broad specificity phosphatase PhoE
MAVFHFVRHGERQDFVDKEWKANAPLLERDNPPLSESGHSQAQHLVQFFKENPVDFVLVSPMTRTVQTASYVAQELGLEVIIENGLIEWPAPGIYTARRVYSASFFSFSLSRR